MGLQVRGSGILNSWAMSTEPSVFEAVEASTKLLVPRFANLFVPDLVLDDSSRRRSFARDRSASGRGVEEDGHQIPHAEWMLVGEHFVTAIPVAGRGARHDRSVGRVLGGQLS